MRGYAMAGQLLRQAYGLLLRCRWYIFDWHSSLLFSFYKAQKYKDFLKRQNVWRIFLPYKVEIANCKLQIGFFICYSMCLVLK